MFKKLHENLGALLRLGKEALCRPAKWPHSGIVKSLQNPPHSPSPSSPLLHQTQRFLQNLANPLLPPVLAFQ
uniref:Uncharacterized protein n=1 Tax=Caenorhabditis japonica TaxID=281687 RepID=A0A8R1IMW1_CAEJA